MKLWELIGEGTTDAVAGAASISSVVSQDLCPLMVPHSLATPRAATPVPQSHALSRLGGARSTSPELPVMMDGVATSLIDLSHTPAPMDSAHPCANALGKGCQRVPFMPASCSMK
jgi:hypothetical protein